MDINVKKKFSLAGYSIEQIDLLEPLVLEINRLKEEKNAVILAHSYQTPDIIYGVADFVGDSYGLSLSAKQVKANTIIFCGVRFMAETAKILNPDKTVLLPAPMAGCSLASSITANDVIALKKKHPGVQVVSYVNTSAEVKANSDVCCTSSNALQIIEAMEGNEVIFLPDELMKNNLQLHTSKKLIGWDGRCIAHESFSTKKLKFFKLKYPGLKILAHYECAPDVAAFADLVGGTGEMIKYVREQDADYFMLVTECGLHERMKAEFPDKNFIGMCALCPYMKMTNLQFIRQVLLDPKPAQIIDIDLDIATKARRSLVKMFDITSGNEALLNV
jgi:quinolinate synthase